MNYCNKAFKDEIKREYKNNFKKSIKEIMKIKLMPIYSYLNSQYFLDKKLNEKFQKIEWSKRMTSSAGKCTGDGIIRLSVDYHRKHPEEIESTVAHEMIHLYVKNHGYEFVSEMNRINEKSDLDITINSQERANVNWVSICPNHGVTGTRTKTPKHDYVCSMCNEDVEWVEIL